MKKTLLSLLMFLALPLMAQVSNPSIIPVASAPSGSCSVNLPDQQVVYLGTVYTCQSGTWAQLSGGGSSLPTAATGQILTNTSGSTTYAGQANIFYQQSGDTIASIETACSSACTYVVTSPQTITLAASHAMNANVWVQFEANGSWTVNGSGFTLSAIQVNGGSTTTQHFVAGSGSVALGAYNTQVPIEWFGAVGGTTLPSTDSTTPIQTCFNDIYAGQCVGQALIYKTTAALTITRSSVGFHGVMAGRGLPTTIETTSTTADILDVGGVNLAGTIVWNFLNNFSLARSASATGTTDKGLSMIYAGGFRVDSVASNDSHINFYYHSAPSYGESGTTNSTCGWTQTYTTGSFYCYYMDSANGEAENSIRFDHAGGSQGTLGGSTTSYGFYISGTQINDVEIYNPGTAGIGYSVYVVNTGGVGAASSGDIHVTNPILDNCLIDCVYISNLTSAQGGSVNISNGWLEKTSGSGNIVDIESSAGVKIQGNMIENPYTGAISGVAGVKINTGAHISVVDNTFINSGQYQINPIGMTGSVIANNTIYGTSGVTTAIYNQNSSIGNSYTGNTMSGTQTYGMTFDATSGSNGYVNNTCGASIGTCISDGGTGNGIGTVTAAPTSNPSTSGIITAKSTGLGTPQNFNDFFAFGPVDYVGANLAAPTVYYSLGFGLSGGTPGTNFVLGLYSSSWQAGLTMNPSTLAATFAGAVTAPSVNGTLLLTGATSTITGTALTATCDSGTATVAGAVVGHPVAVSSTTGADVGGAFNLRGSVTSTNTVTVYVCGTGTPSSLAYNVVVF